MHTHTHTYIYIDIYTCNVYSNCWTSGAVREKERYIMYVHAYQNRPLHYITFHYVLHTHTHMAVGQNHGILISVRIGMFAGGTVWILTHVYRYIYIYTHTSIYKHMHSIKCVYPHWFVQEKRECQLAWTKSLSAWGRIAGFFLAAKEATRNFNCWRDLYPGLWSGFI